MKLNQKIIFTAGTLLALVLVSKAANAKTINCNDYNGHQFVIEEMNPDKAKATILNFTGEDLYQGGVLSLVDQKNGVMSTKKTYSLAQNGVLTISEKIFVGRGGVGRGGFDDSENKIIKSKLTSYEKDYIFSCF